MTKKTHTTTHTKTKMTTTEIMVEVCFMDDPSNKVSSVVIMAESVEALDAPMVGGILQVPGGEKKDKFINSLDHFYSI